MERQGVEVRKHLLHIEELRQIRSQLLGQRIELTQIVPLFGSVLQQVSIKRAHELGELVLPRSSTTTTTLATTTT